MPTRMVVLVCVLATPLAAPFCLGLRLFLHAVCFGVRRLDQALISKESQTVEDRSRIV